MRVNNNDVATSMGGMATLQMAHCEPWVVNRWALRTLFGRAETLVSDLHDVYAFRQGLEHDGLDLEEKHTDQRLRLARAIAQAADELRVEYRHSEDPRDRVFAERLDVLRDCLADLAGPAQTDDTDDRETHGLEARPVDKRDTRFEFWEPTYRVYFWRQSGAGWASREFAVSGADAPAVFDWARRNATDDETSTIFAVIRVGDELGLVHLAGTDPSSP
jgi:hypothetical protein